MSNGQIKDAINNQLTINHRYLNNIIDRLDVSNSAPNSDATAALQSAQLTQETLTALNTNTGNIIATNINSKITKGNDATLVEAQQVLAYGCDFAGDLRPIKVGTTGKLQVEVDGIRSSSNQLAWTIATGTTGHSTEIDMGTHTRIAFYGETDNTIDANIRFEYSQDGTNWFRGSDANAKIVVISATGNFYDEERVTPPRVRLSRSNTSGVSENINLYWTQL